MRLAPAVLACAAVVVGCGSDSPAPPAPPPQRIATLPPDAPAELKELRDQASTLLSGGKVAFARRLRELRGHPVVVNKWASWCGPCRAEFPFFANQAGRTGDRVAFLGVNSQDVADDARKFLLKNHVPYPSYSDPDQEVAGVFKGKVAFPATAFYDAKGELVYLKQGGYASERKLSDDIDRYAR
ncbi:MAG: TlpA family protein disulfide reductase [Actinomycetota bacterium]|nr:TlpA family protein disulfide reductase [Actinomycetota bacterium]